MENNLQDRMDQIENYWEHFKNVNNERLKEIETKSISDSLTDEKLNKLNKLNNLIDAQQEEIKKLKNNIARNNIEVKTIENNSENCEYKAAFNDYLKKGSEFELINLEKKAGSLVSMDTNSSGFFMAPNIQKIIMDSLSERCVMRKICSVQEISTNSLDVISSSAFDTNWGDETSEILDTDAAGLIKKTIATFDLVAQPKVTQKLIDDSAINFEEWLAYQLFEDFLVAEETAFIAGDGVNKPKGILNYSDSDIKRTTSTSTDSFFTMNDVLNLYYSLDEKYVNNASFLMSRSAIQEIRKFKDPISGLYLWNPAILSGQENTLLGCPVYQTGNINNVEASKDIIILGDFSKYQIVDRMGIKILRDPFTAKPYIRFYTTKRIGGDVIDKNAFKILKTANI